MHAVLDPAQVQPGTHGLPDVNCNDLSVIDSAIRIINTTCVAAEHGSGEDDDDHDHRRRRRKLSGDDDHGLVPFHSDTLILKTSPTEHAPCCFQRPSPRSLRPWPMILV